MISLRRIFAPARHTPTDNDSPLSNGPSGRWRFAAAASGLAISTIAVGLFVASTSATPGQEEAPSASLTTVVAFLPDFGASSPEMDNGALSIQPSPTAIQPSPTATLVSEVAGAVSTSVPQEAVVVASSPTPEPTLAQEAPAAALVATPAQQEVEVLAPVATPVTQEVVTQPVEVASVVAQAMALPAGYTVEVSLVGCTSGGACPFGQTPANFYWAPTRTAVVYPNQSLWTIEHEACHAHQHLTITTELGIEPAMPYDLHEWLSTSEGATWSSLVTTAWPATGQWAIEPGAHNAIEDFGISCGLYMSDPQQLQQIDPIRYAALVALLG